MVRPSAAEGLLFCHNAEAGADCSGIIATGTDASARIGLGHSSGVAMSYNHGCLSDGRSRMRYDGALNLISRHFAPEVIAADSRPASVVGRCARSLARRTGARIVAVGHAHAHAVSVMAQHGLTGEVVAIVLDSSHDDEAAAAGRRVHGSDLLVCSRKESRVAAHADYVPVPRHAEPWESAVGLILHYTGSLRWIPDGMMAAVGHANVIEAARRCSIQHESVLVSGGEHLWDAVAALIATGHGFETGALSGASWLVSQAEGILASPYGIDTRNPLSMEPVLDEMLDDLESHTDPRVVAARFLAARARQWAVAAARECSSRGIRRVVATGGLMAGQLFAMMLDRQMRSLGLEPYFHKTPASADSCIALGQAAVAAALRA